MKKQNLLKFMLSSLFIFSPIIHSEEMSPVSVFGSQDETQQAGSAQPTSRCSTPMDRSTHH